MTSIVNALAKAVGLPLCDGGAKTSTYTGSGGYIADLLDYEGMLTVSQVVGTVSGTTPTLDGKLQGSANGSSGWADITGATFTQVTATGAAQTIAVSASEVPRYIRYVGTIAGTSPSFALSVIANGIKKQS